MTSWAEDLLKTNGTDYVLANLYIADISKHSVIKSDLEFIAHNWQPDSFDLWEETKGSHFFTKMVQRRALKDGAALASKLGDTGAAKYYEEQATALEALIEQFWDGSVIRATMPGSAGSLNLTLT
jgi:glucoamylase